jgi:transcriptional regulator with XRE-family HTH domain
MPTGGDPAWDSIAFGKRLRQLRRERDLTQADLAGEGVSESYVSLLESGKRTPTALVLRALATRLDCDESLLTTGLEPEDLARVELSVTFAELALLNGESEDALTQARIAIESSLAVPAALLWRARCALASALENLGRLEEALGELEHLHSESVAQRRWGEALRLVVQISRCYKEAGDVAHALAVAEAGLKLVDQYELMGTDAHAELASTVIGLHYVQGNHVRAELLADEVLSQLEEGGSRRGRGAVYWNASLNAEGRGDVEKAVVLAERALALYAEGQDERALARLRVAYAWLMLRSAPPRAQRAAQLLEDARLSLMDTGTEVDIAYCETELGRAAILLGDARKGLKWSRAAVKRLGPKPRLQTAHARLVVARAHLTLGMNTEAIAEYRVAAAALGNLGMSRQSASAWRELADAFTDLKLFEDAALAYQQALSEAGVRASPDVNYPAAAQSTSNTSTGANRRS